MSNPTIYGFTLLRNVFKYDYCFKESLNSLAKVTKKIFIALGEGEDDTVSYMKNLACESNHFYLVDTIWDLSRREGARVLSDQTNIALKVLREETKNDLNAWGVYLQADEVIPEWHYEQLCFDIKKAHGLGYDAVSFRYLHFWQDHFQVAINKKWYPNEIRAIKLKGEAVSWGDAQSFKNVKKIFYSDATIFHYGHVREKKSYKDKKRDILKLYHDEDKLKKYQKKEKRFDNQTRCLKYLGPHPSNMYERIKKIDEIDLHSLSNLKNDEKMKKIVVLGLNKEELSTDFKEKINKSAHFHFFPNRKDFLNSGVKSDIIIYLKPNFFTRLWNKDFIPKKMDSKKAFLWDLETLLSLKLSQKNIFIS